MVTVEDQAGFVSVIRPRCSPQGGLAVFAFLRPLFLYAVFVLFSFFVPQVGATPLCPASLPHLTPTPHRHPLLTQ